MTEQPDPAENDRSVIQQIVIDDLHDRWALGRERYGNKGVQVGNERRMSVDALEEAQDLLIYMTGVREQDDEITLIVHHLLTLHEGFECVCLTCNQAYPCHTRTDLLQILKILGTSPQNTAG